MVVQESARKWGLPVVVLILLCTAAFSFVYLARERQHTRELAVTNETLSTSLSQVQTQLQAVSERLNAVSAAKPVESEQAPAARPRRAKARAGAGRAEDPRWRKIQGQLSEQQQQIAKTREDVDKNREDLEGKLGSARDELNGSIARTHDEVVALQKRGERNYYEFQLDRSKQFQKVGPISLSLRKVNFKRRRYDVAMMIDDNQIEKKNVNLFEPVWINLTDRPQPVEIVINQIHKNQIVGYMSEPKYKKSELAANSPAPVKTEPMERKQEPKPEQEPRQ